MGFNLLEFTTMFGHERGDEQIHPRLIKRLQQDKPIKGFHGTCAEFGHQIEDEGFANQICIEGEYGIWFWDEEAQNNAIIKGQYKATQKGDTEYAVVEAELHKPQPDTKGRPQWLVDARDAKITSVRYFNLDGIPRK